MKGVRSCFMAGPDSALDYGAIKIGSIKGPVRPRCGSTVLGAGHIDDSGPYELAHTPDRSVDLLHHPALRERGASPELFARPLSALHGAEN